jgi:penicillin amidase
MRCLKNPEKGFLATANAKPTCDDKSPFLGADWIDGYRLASIVEALSSRKDWDLKSTQVLQLDQRSIPWRELKDKVLGVPANNDEVAQAHMLLRSWDGILSSDSAAASIFELFMNELTHRVIKAKAPKASRWILGEGCTLLMPFSVLSVKHVGRLVRLIREQPDGWFTRSWDEELADALKNAMLDLKSRYGKDIKNWTWGHIRSLTLRHPVGEKSPFDRIFNLGPILCGGDANTIAQASVDPFDPGENPLFIACLRMVIDVGNWDESRFAIPGGQSGNPLSPHYADQLPLWQNGKGVPISWSAKQIEEHAETTLILKPEGQRND